MDHTISEEGIVVDHVFELGAFRASCDAMRLPRPSQLARYDARYRVGLILTTDHEVRAIRRTAVAVRHREGPPTCTHPSHWATADARSRANVRAARSAKRVHPADAVRAAYSIDAPEPGGLPRTSG